MAEKTKTPPAPTDSKEKEDEKEQPRNSVAEWAVTILLLLFGTTTLVQAFVIPTGSMEDTLLVGDHLLVDKLAYAPAGSFSKYLLPYETPKHGDIIVFRYPVDIRQTFVKRVIGIPGDHIKLDHGRVFRNGVKLNEPYIFRKGLYQQRAYDPYRDDFPAVPPSGYDGGVYPPLLYELQHDMLTNHVANAEVVVPPDHYFAMGDNRDNSLDSRYWGFVPRENIIGKPIIIYWSYRASTEDLAGSSVDSLVSHMVDLAQHFFTRTRWSRTLNLVRGFPDSKLPDHELPVNNGLEKP